LTDRTVAYFSMEIALGDEIPTYSGGLGVLAGDTIRSAADLGVPMAAVTLLYRKGYFRQRLDAAGRQTEEPVTWNVERHLAEEPARAHVKIEGRKVYLRAWRRDVTGLHGRGVPVYLLDADLPENAPQDRGLTDHLYGGDARYRVAQEAILGIGGVRMLRALGHDRIRRYHMNEGHAAFLALALLRDAARAARRKTISYEDIQRVREQCVFTTHTPVPAGHDQFPMSLVTQVLGTRERFLDLADPRAAEAVRRVFAAATPPSSIDDVLRGENVLNMTLLAMNFSRYVNGVAKRHGEVTRQMFNGYHIDAITNGVHAPTWVSEPFQALYDRHLPGWREDGVTLRHALRIPRADVWDAHMAAKQALIEFVGRAANVALDPNRLTIGFARRMASYKRGDLLFTDVDRVRRIAAESGPLQIVFAGKAHPRDAAGKGIIERIFQMRDALAREVPIAYLENYDTAAALHLVSGVDVWLNNPQPPLEASGTSGMKSALNGVPSLSTLDGWWLEGHIEGVTGWAIGADTDRAAPGRGVAGEAGQGGLVAAGDPAQAAAADARSLYDKLERDVVPTYYHDRARFLDVMRYAISINGSYFTTQRMMSEYVVRAYFP
jgi:starch phosphorylase